LADANLRVPALVWEREIRREVKLRGAIRQGDR